MIDGEKDLSNSQLLRMSFDELVRQYDLGLEYFLRFLLLTLAIVSISVGFLVNLSMKPLLFHTICFFNFSILAMWFIPAGFCLKFEKQMRVQLDSLVARLGLPIPKGIFSMLRIVILISLVGDVLCICLFGYFFTNQEQFLSRSQPQIYRLNSVGTVHVPASKGEFALADVRDVFASSMDASALEYSVLGNKQGIKLDILRDTLFLKTSDTTEWTRTFLVICASKAGTSAVDTVVVFHTTSQGQYLQGGNIPSVIIHDRP